MKSCELVTELLRDGRCVEFVASGESMRPTILPGARLEVHPLPPDEVREGDVVVFAFGEGLRVHRVEARLDDAARGSVFVCRGDNLPSSDPPVAEHEVLGRVTRITQPPARGFGRALVVATERVARALRTPSATWRRTLRRMWLWLSLVVLIALNTGVAVVDGQPRETGWALAKAGATKIRVSTSGWSRVPFTSLQAAGHDVSTDPRRWALYRDGKPVRMRVRGEEDGRFGPGDTLEFYAVADETPYSATSTYWLTLNATEALRVRDASWASSEPLTRLEAYLETVGKKYTSLYVPGIKNGEAENFFGAVVTDEGIVDDGFAVRNLRTDVFRAAEVTVSVQAGTDGEHRFTVSVGSRDLGEAVFTGPVLHTATWTFDPGFLREGANEIAVRRSSGRAQDLMATASIVLRYPRSFVAIDNRLTFVAPPQSSVEIAGFASPSIEVWDVTNPADVRRVPASVSGAGTFSASVAVSAAEPRVLTAVAPRQNEVPPVVEIDVPSQWHNAANEARLAIIAHGSLLEAIRPLASARRHAGWATALVNIDDVYDEFGFGMKTPHALKEWISHARVSWKTKPDFVLLVGDASADSRDYLGRGNFDLIPTRTIETRYIETASDDWFVDANDDGVPDAAIGRIPARTSAEVALIVDKTLRFQPRAEAEQASGLMLSDRLFGFDFASANARVGASIDSQRATLTFVQRAESDTGVLPAFVQGLQEQPSFVVYFGHGSAQTWAGSALTSETVSSLPQLSSLPILLSMTCLNGLFHDPSNEALGETLLRADGRGVVAAWVSSTLTEPWQQEPMAVAALHGMVHQRLPVGEAVRLAKQGIFDADVRRSWVLLGDPTLQLWHPFSSPSAGMQTAGNASEGYVAEAGAPEARNTPPQNEQNERAEEAGCSIRSAGSPASQPPSGRPSAVTFTWLSAAALYFARRAPRRRRVHHTAATK